MIGMQRKKHIDTPELRDWAPVCTHL